MELVGSLLIPTLPLIMMTHLTLAIATILVNSRILAVDVLVLSHLIRPIQMILKMLEHQSALVSQS